MAKRNVTNVQLTFNSQVCRHSAYSVQLRVSSSRGVWSVGLAEVQIARAIGADVVAVSRTEDKLRFADARSDSIECHQLLDDEWAKD